jgi:hypothetical protein
MAYTLKDDDDDDDDDMKEVSVHNLQSEVCDSVSPFNYNNGIPEIRNLSKKDTYSNIQILSRIRTITSGNKIAYVSSYK